ncbi:hypothetical protein EDM52_00520 [Brevibacillus invocatus]|uniref:Uncharacterized protein n=1 Tax=Brevibacillus invocatus TaxID=173959 RepID=A0A3M8CP13_9BACL|nr:hypothetical protein EDM52_00520 [Brevibacillus invocatus]
MFLKKNSRKPLLLVLAGAVAAGSLWVTPIVDVHAAAVKKVQAAAVTPVPVTITKGIQQVVRLVPELSKRHVVYIGEVDGPGVSGVAIAFAESAKDPNPNGDRAVFDPTTGDLLILELKPQKSEKPATLTDAQASTKAVAFVTGLQNIGNTYQSREVVTKDGLTTVRLVRKINHVSLDDAYDSFVTFDSTGRLIGFRNFNGKSHEKLIAASFPPATRAISSQQALQRYNESKPLELIYLLPENAPNDKRVEARLVYLVKDGIISQSHTGSALDAMNGKRLLDLQPSVQTVNLNGTGERWSAMSDSQAADLVRWLFKAEPGKLPLVSFEEKREDGSALRYFIWGYFRQDAANADKQYELGMFPDTVKPEEKKHLMLVTNAKTGEVLRFVSKDEVQKNGKLDKKRDWSTAEEALRRLLPTGPNPILLSDVGNEQTTLITADMVVNGTPVYREGQRLEEGMYTISIQGMTGAIEEFTVNRPSDMVFQQASKSIPQQAAVNQLLKSYPLELTYVHMIHPETGAVTWKLAYDLSFRQTKAHCFCGGEQKMDATIQVDALTGKVTVKE